jgi:starch synthase
VVHVEKMKVLFLSPEVVPFAKTGGLADVASALPASLKRLGVDVRLILPFYRCVKQGNYATRPRFDRLEIPFGDGMLKAKVLEVHAEEGVPVYLIERDDLYDRAGLYGNALGDYYDNLERFTFFSYGALRISERLSFTPDLIHCNDWQTGMLPALLRGSYARSAGFSEIPVVFTIHNLAYQGLFPAGKLAVTGLPEREFFRPEGLEFWGKISFLKAGIVYSQAITTVSPSYAREIQTPEYGLGMEGVLRDRSDSLYGVLNGADYAVWDPERDIHLPDTYSPGRMAGKRRCKDLLMRELDLDLSLKDRPLLGMISRFDAQKGFGLLVKVLDEILALNVSLVVLGSGDGGIQKALRRAANRAAGRLAVRNEFDEPLAHRIMAGSDIFLIPSRYEPCGLTQMYALKYGTVPVVRATGGLDDTIRAFDPESGQGNGFKFGPYDSGALAAEIRKALKFFEDSRAWKRLMDNAMKEDFSWEHSAKRYLEIYGSVMR